MHLGLGFNAFNLLNGLHAHVYLFCTMAHTLMPLPSLQVQARTGATQCWLPLGMVHLHCPSAVWR